MEQKDRAKIDQCVDKMVSLIDIESIWPRLFINQIFNRDDVNVPKWKDRLKLPEVKRDILMKIQTRGPNAFKNLIKCLRETHQEHLIILLENPQSDISINISNAAISHPSTNNNYTYDPDNKLIYNPIKAGEVLKIKVKKSTTFMEIDGKKLYPMKSNPRGLVLIITIIKYIDSNRNRSSAEHDHNNLKDLFTQMGFEVYEETNLTTDEIRENIKTFSQNKKLRRVDSCFVIISAHGDSTDAKESVIHGADHTGVTSTPHKEIKCSEIIQYFSARNCPNLIKKPKVFIFQACRGTNNQTALSHQNSHHKNKTVLLDLDIGEYPNSEPIVRSETESVRNYDDIVVFQSTLSNHVSLRDSEYGSWFIQILCEVFMKRAYCSDLLRLLRDVDDRLGELRTREFSCQTATIKLIGFNKDLYINPGFFE